jgi:hypothetical protein
VRGRGRGRRWGRGRAGGTGDIGGVCGRWRRRCGWRWRGWRRCV